MPSRAFAANLPFCSPISFRGLSISISTKCTPPSLWAPGAGEGIVREWPDGTVISDDIRARVDALWAEFGME